MLRTEALAVLLLATTLDSGIALVVLTAFSVGMTGRAAPAVVPLVYVTVVGSAGPLALGRTALPGRAAPRVPPVTVVTAKEVGRGPRPRSRPPATVEEGDRGHGGGERAA